MISYSPSSPTATPINLPAADFPPESVETNLSPASRQRWLIALAASFLVSGPVFIEAPLVRLFPVASVLIGLIMGGLGYVWRRQVANPVWSDLLVGFAWTWVAGSLYWGWFRWEPYWHLPIEAIGLPFALWGIVHNHGKIGNFFYLGSLLGTAVTDLYFYQVNLIPAWRQLMQANEALARPILHAALAQVQSPQGLLWAMILAIFLLVVSLLALRSVQLHWWAMGGAVLSTIFVDMLFGLLAYLA